MTVHVDTPSAGVLRLTIDEPGTRNALSAATMSALDAGLEQLRTDPSAHVALLTGAGEVFCSGGDTRRMGPNRPTPWDKRTYLEDGVGRLARTFLRLDKPVIALVNGPAVGAGLDLALWCDFRMASAVAYFLPGFVDMGVTPGFGSALHLARLLGHAAAMEVFLTGRRITADDALHLGVLRAVTADRDELASSGLAFAADLAAKPQPAVRATKRLIQRETYRDVIEHLDLAWSTFALLQETPEHQEAVVRRSERRAAAAEARSPAEQPSTEGD